MWLYPPLPLPSDNSGISTSRCPMDVQGTVDVGHMKPNRIPSTNGHGNRLVHFLRSVQNRTDRTGAYSKRNCQYGHGLCRTVQTQIHILALS